MEYGVALHQAYLAKMITDMELGLHCPKHWTQANRAIQEGYWEQPKSFRTSDGTTVTVKPGPRRDWYNPEIVEPEGAKIISSAHSPGMHGGYWTIEVLVPVEVA